MFGFASGSALCAVISSHMSSRTAHVMFLHRLPPPQVAEHFSHGPASQWWYVQGWKLQFSIDAGTTAEVFARHSASGTTLPPTV